MSASRSTVETRPHGSERAVHPERLLERAGLAAPGSQPGPGPGSAAGTRAAEPTAIAGPVAGWRARRARMAAGLLGRLVERLHADGLDIVDVDGTRWSSPARAGTPRPTLCVRDERAWWAVASEGSVGLGRGYLERWWTTDDPTGVVRVLIRNLEPLDEVRNRLQRVSGWAVDPVRRRVGRSSRERDRDNVQSHYDLGNDFFELFLDETMTYSSAVFEHPSVPLAQASTHKYDVLLGKLGVEADHHLLEVGSGWGGLALRAAGRTGCRVTTATVSARQAVEARRRIAAAGLDDRVDVVERDWRLLAGRFDRIVSIEMIEALHWRDYERYFATLGRCLRPDGLVGIQAILAPDRRYERVKHTEDFIRRFVFPGGHLPSLDAISRAAGRASRLQIVDVEDFSAHYAETLRRWRTRFDSRLDEVRALGLDERFVRLWRFYLAYCEAAFLERHCTVAQIVLAGPQWRPDGLGRLG